MSTVYLNGQFLPIEAAHISPLDRGFLFGDGVYEVISVYQGKLFHAQEHLDRLNRSLDAIRLSSPFQKDQWLSLIHELLQRNQITHQTKSIYLQITRGTDTKRDHLFPSADTAPTVFIFLMDLHPPGYEKLQQGFKAITYPDHRWDCCHIKSILLLPNILASQTAKDNQATEALLIRNGYVLEGASSNVFTVKDNVIQTPPLGEFILGGVIRDIVLELAKQNHLQIQETSITKEALFNADEVWITSSTREIMPIIDIDHQQIGTGKSGPLWHRMIRYFHALINTSTSN